ncbi:hypothetical protein H6768_06345 [Candidatus Peribacteria bacterium]|nr:hypothetical protein [Candidatus Peribacteria bacterium]
MKDTWGNTIDLTNWKMSVTSTTKISLLPLASQINTTFSGKAVDALTVTPIEA